MTKEITKNPEKIVEYVVDDGQLVIVTSELDAPYTIVTRTRIPLDGIIGYSLSCSFKSEYDLALSLGKPVTFEREIYLDK